MSEQVAHECGWTIYRPPEYPKHWAVSQWWVLDDGVVAPEPVAVLCDSLDDAREQIPSGAICVPREDDDDPMIVETWL